MAKWLYSIGSFAARKAWAVIAIWVLVIAGVAGVITGISFITIRLRTTGN